jgi:hypothetical protein
VFMYFWKSASTVFSCANTMLFPLAPSILHILSKKERHHWWLQPTSDTTWGSNLKLVSRLYLMKFMKVYSVIYNLIIKLFSHRLLCYITFNIPEIKFKCTIFEKT